MHLFQKQDPPKNEYLRRFTDMAKRFEAIGIVTVLTAVLINLSGNNSMKLLSFVIFAIGAIILAFGGSSALPHNLIKSFSMQCASEPNDLIAEGLLEAMERNRKTALTKSSLKNVYLAIETYAACEDADPELVARLRQATDKHLTKKVF